MMKHLIGRKILEVLDGKPRMTADLLSNELGTSKQYIHNTLRLLSGLQLVRTASRGVYDITDLGRLVLHKIKAQNSGGSQ